jgi:branched-chain amino acid transport system ATP-binding protein
LALCTDLTVLENLLVVPPDQAGERLWTPWLRPGRIQSEEARLREQAGRVLEQVGLARVPDEPAWTLSGGQKKLLELGRVLMANPKLLMLDEPGAGVNPTQMKELTRYIQRLAAERGITILLIEHDIDLVMAVLQSRDRDERGAPARGRAARRRAPRPSRARRIPGRAPRARAMSLHE